MLEGKRVLLIIAGGIAAYKSLDLIRRLKECGVEVRTILTRAGAEFVTPLSVAALSGEKAYDDLFSLTDEAEMGHIRLSREADLVIVAPATANLMAKMAGGLADDLASTALLATDKPVMLAPAMNVEMWTKPSTQRNVQTLARDGVLQVGPEGGLQACGEVGPGRMTEVADIIAAVEAFFLAAKGPMSGRRALVTSGPTHEPIDPVRYLANRSSGKQGHAVARALASLGAETTLVTGPSAEADPQGVHAVHVQTAREMLDACTSALPADVAVCAAAVSDWRAKSAALEKIKKDKSGKNGDPALNLVENPDVLASLATRPEGRPALVVGFAAETQNVLANARAKLASKGCDWIVANDVSEAGGVMGGEHNTVHLLTADGDESWPTLSKQAVAEGLASRIADHFSRRNDPR